jgi:hypothetical protein
MPQTLTRLKIQEISSVDAGAGEGVRVCLMKRAGDELRDVLDEGIRRGVLRGGFEPPPDAAPRAMPRIHKQQETPCMPDSFSSIVKDCGFIQVAKALDTGPSTRAISEHEFTGAATRFAMRIYPGERPDVAYSKMRSAGDARARLVSRVTQKIRDRQWANAAEGTAVPWMLNEDSEGPEEERAYGERADLGREMKPPGAGGLADTDKRGGDAYVQLQKLATELRQREPSLTREQAFAKVFCSPAHRALAERERRESRPRVR